MTQQMVPQPVTPLADLALELMTESDLLEVIEMEQISHQHPWTRGNFLDSIAAGHWAYCVREVNDPDNTLWAYCILLPAVDDLHLLNITVNPELRRQGIGLRVMHAIHGIAQKMQIPRVLLEVRPSNQSAIALYEKAGYEILATRKGYYPLESPSGQREDALVMTKTIYPASKPYEH